MANATGMTVAREACWVASIAGHVDELTKRYDVDELRELGGIVDYVVGAQPGPGVFVLGTHDDPEAAPLPEPLQARRGPAVLLLHALPPMSLRGADLGGARGSLRRRGDGAGGTASGRGRHRAKIDLSAGDKLDGMGAT